MENVWDYPRPPALVSCERRVRVEIAGSVVADSVRAWRVLETSHPPTVYVPPEDIAMECFVPSASAQSWCEFKGAAHYLDYVGDGNRRAAVAWRYPAPSPAYVALRDHLAFYPGRVDAAYLDEERVEAQVGDFYGGWITADLGGPFKGGPGTRGW